MSTLESEIMDKFHQLPFAAKQRIRALIEQETESLGEQSDQSSFDYAKWFHEVEILRQQIRSRSDDKPPSIDVVGILRAIRDDEDE